MVTTESPSLPEHGHPEGYWDDKSVHKSDPGLQLTETPLVWGLECLPVNYLESVNSLTRKNDQDRYESR